MGWWRRVSVKLLISGPIEREWERRWFKRACSINSSARSTFRSNTWGVKIGTDTTTRNGGTGPAGAQQNGGYGGTGYNGAHGGGGGSSALLFRGSTLIAGAGGGGGAGADGYDGGDGQHGGYNPGNAAGITGGSLRKVGGNTGLDAGYGGQGGGYGCRGGGGGGGGAGCAENGFSGFGGGGGGGTPGSGGHDGGDGGKQGPSAVRTLYFESNTASSSSHTSYTASIKMDVTWDGSYWHAAGGGGGGGAYFKSNISWSQLNNPSSISWSVGGAGSGVSNGGRYDVSCRFFQGAWQNQSRETIRLSRSALGIIGVGRM